MPRTKPKPEPVTTAGTPPTGGNGLGGEVLTLSEAAGYLRLPEGDVLRLIEEQSLPARRLGSEWRFLKSAIQEWLSQPVPKKKNIWDMAGIFKDDPHLDEIVKEAMRRRGRKIAEDE